MIPLKKAVLWKEKQQIKSHSSLCTNVINLPQNTQTWNKNRRKTGQMERQNKIFTFFCKFPLKVPCWPLYENYTKLLLSWTTSRRWSSCFHSSRVTDGGVQQSWLHIRFRSLREVSLQREVQINSQYLCMLGIFFFLNKRCQNVKWLNIQACDNIVRWNDLNKRKKIWRVIYYYVNFDADWQFLKILK